MYNRQLYDFLDSLSSLSCHEWAARLTLLGLAVELLAIGLILASVGAFDPAVGWATSNLRRLVAWFGRWFLGQEPIIVRGGTASTTEGVSAGSVGIVVRDDAQAPPKTLEEVGDRLNRIAADLNAIDRKINDKDDAMRRHVSEEINQVRSEAASRYQQLDARVVSEARRQVLQRRNEGVLFMAGLVLQGGGATLILVC